ncbi:MAG: hypothetical protein AB7R89_28650 [Dehalococcoidia bacterium]
MRFTRLVALKLGWLFVAALLLCGIVSATATEAARPVQWSEVVAWTEHDAARFGVSADWLLAVLWCESTGNAYAYGAAGEIGPAQMHPRGIWYSLPESRQVALDYSRASLRLQVQAMARAFSYGWQRHWTCARMFGG